MMELFAENDGSMPKSAVPVESLLKPHDRGIYFLWRDGVVVYIGMSTNLVMRIADHNKNGKCDFTHVTWMVLNEHDDLAAVEAALIDHFLPEGNKVLDLEALRQPSIYGYSRAMKT